MSSVCPRPPCPVVDVASVDLRRRRLTSIGSGTVLHRVGSVRHPLHVLNPTTSSVSRFAPRAGRAHAYVARRRTVALLETVFHDVAESPGDRRIYAARDLGGRQLGPVLVSRALRLLDLRDEASALLGIARDQLIATPPAHYGCSRAVAEVLSAFSPGGVPVDGMIWQSRVAELARRPSALLDDLLTGESADVIVLYGEPGPGSSPLAEVVGATPVALLPRPGAWPPLVDDVAEHLGAEIH